MSDRRVCEHCRSELSPKWGQGFCPFCGKSILPLRAAQSGGAYKTPVSVKPKHRSQSGSGKARRNAPAHELPFGRHEKTASNARILQSAEGAREKPLKPPKRERIANLRTAAENSKAPVLLFVSPLWLFIQNLFSLGLRGIFWFRFNEKSLRALVRKETELPAGVCGAWCSLVFAYAGCVLGLIAEGFLSLWDFSEIASSILLKPAVCFFLLSWLISRYMLFWMRWIILENIFSSLADIKGARSLKPFAPDALLLWFFGASYMQRAINGLIWANVFRPYLRDKTRRGRKHVR